MHAIGRPYGMILVTGPTGSGKTVSLYTCLNILNQPGRQHLDRRGPGGNPAGRHQPGQHQREGGPHLRGRAAGVPAAGSGHHHGRRNPRPRDRRDRDQGGADGPPGAVHAAHQRRADDAAAAANMGVAPFNVASSVILITAQRLGRKLCPQVQEAPGHPARGAAAGRLHRRRPGRHVAAVRPGRLRPLQHGVQGPRRHLPGDADLRRDAPAHHAQRHRHRHRRPGDARRASSTCGNPA